MVAVRAVHRLAGVRPGLGALLRRASLRTHGPGERTAITESNLFWSLLFLNNNLHAVHHVFPKMPWWQIPAYWRAHREQILAHNGNLYFRGYGEIAATVAAEADLHAAASALVTLF